MTADSPNPPPHRKRLRRRETDHLPRFVTFSCYKRLQLLGTARLRSAFLEHLAAARPKHRFGLIAYVVMPEHVHLIVNPPALDDGLPWGTIAARLKSDVARAILGRWRRLDAPILAKLKVGKNRYRFWQHGGGFDRNVRHDAEMGKEIRYIHRNPVKRGLVQEPTDWEHSSARYWQARHEGRSTDGCGLPCDLPVGSDADRLSWLLWPGFM